MCITHASHSLKFPAWFEAVRALECLSLICILLCLAAEVYMDFLSQPSPDRRLVEMFALAAGMCGLIGSIIFAIYTPLSSSKNFSWGFGLATASSCFYITFASVIAFFRRKGLDVANYSASNAVHYCASDGVVVPQGINAMELGPPAYNDVVNQPGVGGSSASGVHPSHPSHYSYFKPPSPVDSQPPPAYYPPPPAGQFEAPPPYTIVPSSSVMSAQPGDEQFAESRSVPVFPAGSNTGPGQVNSGTSPLDSENSSADQDVPESETTSPPGMDPGVTGAPLVSSVPAYYVTVLGQMVPVFLEELQQAGRGLPAPGAPVPAYFIMTQGQHVPVYSEEQARVLNN